MSKGGRSGTNTPATPSTTTSRPPSRRVLVPSVPKAVPGDQNSIAARYARLKALQDASSSKSSTPRPTLDKNGHVKSPITRLGEWKAAKFAREWVWVWGFFAWLLFIHVSGLYFFTRGFLLTRLVLEEKSSCGVVPDGAYAENGKAWKGSVEAGCWHPKTFDKAIVVIIDALRYDFTIPYEGTEKDPEQAYHNALPFLYETAVREPHNAFLRPFIADPPTATMQRLKGLTTGTLPTFIDIGSNFAGTAIEEDNLLMQMRDTGRKMVHLGDDTWTALFPGYFEPNISRAYDSFNVWDLHTVDEGVNEHIFPLLQKEMMGKWDVMFAHYLGVDHAGHRYGPNHPAMTAKLRQMDTVLRELVAKLDEETLLVVMGDHGMDAKGDHGGESDDEVQAALWMYSKKGVFGRTQPEFAKPPQHAKERSVDQIDLVPTLALLLGLPIPFNNLGKPIEEAFAGKKGTSWENLANVVRITAAGIKRYQAAYFVARGIDESTIDGSPRALWALAETAHETGRKQKLWQDAYTTFSAYQEENLRVCRDLWARFDVPSMCLGIGILAASVLALVLFANSNADTAPAEPDNEGVARAQLQLEIDDFAKGNAPDDVEETTSRSLVRGALMGSFLGAAAGPTVWIATGGGSILEFGLALTSISGVVGVLYQEMRRRMSFANPFPTTFWGWLAATFTIAQSIGYSANSFTIWEDSISLFFLSTFGFATAVSSLRLEKKSDMTLGVYHSLVFVALGWASSFSKLCREEQMPYCRSTYYASANSSTSAPWQLAIPFVIAILLPSIIKSYFASSRNYEGLAPLWIGWAFRAGLFMSAVFWTLDAADDGQWFPYLHPKLLKNVRVPLAQTVFAIAVGAGSVAFGWADPCVSIVTEAIPTTSSSLDPDKPTATLTVLGYANTHGTRYFLLLINILLCALMVQKPMGAGALSLMTWQILSLLEILDLNSLSTSPIGPIILALLGSFHFFKTGHQATLSSIQWESAFIPLHTIRYPWSPILIALNSFGAQILAAVAVPLVVLWKQKPQKKGLLRSVSAAVAWHLCYYAVVGTATTMWAGWLRRHLMLYRIFSPKFMSSGIVLVVVEVVVLAVVLVGFRWNTGKVGETFGWG